MSMIGCWGWDTANTKWVKLLVDAAGNLQVDVVAAGPTEGRCYGWTGAAWTPMLVESLANANLRMKLYDGANAIDSALVGAATIQNTQRGLLANAMLHLYDTTSTSWNAAKTLQRTADATAGERTQAVGLLGFNGVSWDRLRTYATGILKVEKAPIGATVAPVAAAGAVAAGARDIYWIACTPDDPNAEWELSDDTDGSTAEVYCHFDSDKHSEHINFDPPMHFSTGIYVKKFDHIKCLHICYI